MPYVTIESCLSSDVAASLLETVYATVPAGLCLLDTNQRFVVVNARLADLSGLSAKAHTGRTLPDVLGELGRHLQPFCAEVLESGLPIVDQQITGDRKGPPWEGRCWLLSCFPFRLHRGGIAGTSLILAETTERRTTESALRAAEEDARQAVQRLNFALEKADAGEWEVNYRTGAARWSPQIYALYGLPPEIAPSPQAFLALLPPDDRREWQAAKNQVFAEHGQEFRQDFRITHPTKGQRWISSRAYVQYAADGTPERMGGIKIDITELKRVQADLEKAKLEAEAANEAKSRFLAAASHDLRQPLQALNLYHGVLEGHAAASDRLVFRHMESCLSSLNELLGDLLNLSKLDAGVVVPEMGDVSIDDILDRILSASLPEAEKKGLRLRRVATRVVGRTDAILFERLVANLASNAVRYTNTGSVLMGCRRRRGRLWLEIWDTGIGIPKDQTTAIFEPFRQLGNPERSRQKGSGLGLAIAKKTAELLGVEIRVCSQPGKGSVFAVEVPLTRPDSAIV